VSHTLRANLAVVLGWAALAGGLLSIAGSPWTRSPGGLMAVFYRAPAVTDPVLHGG
jgi:hypothetical protein